MAPFNTICDLIANRFPPRFDGLSRPLWLSAISANLVARITLLTRPSFAIGCDVPSSQEFERTFNRSCFRAPREVVLGISGFRISESPGFVVSQGVSRFSREGRETFRERGPTAVFAQGLAVFFAVAMRPDVLGAAGEQGHLRSATVAKPSLTEVREVPKACWSVAATTRSLQTGLPAKFSPEGLQALNQGRVRSPSDFRP